VQTREVVQMRTYALFGAKNSGFFKILGVSSVRTDKEGDVVNLSRFCADVLL